MAKNNNVTGWVGWVYFAAFMILMTGIFQIITGFAALLSPGFYQVQNGTLVAFDLNTWGWIHLLLGIVMMCVGTALFSGKAWARITAIILASLNFLAQFAFVSEYPFWSFIVMTLDVLVIYALTVHGGEAQTD